MTKIINKYSSVRNIILLFGLIFLFNFIVFPISHKVSTELALLDLQITYSPDRAYDILGKYSETERKNYLIGELTVDLIYPVIYTLMLCFSIFLLYGKMKLAKLPILILISDYAENIGIVTMIYNYPIKLATIARGTSTITSIKWFFVFVSIIIILYGLWIKIYSLLLRNNKNRQNKNENKR